MTQFKADCFYIVRGESLVMLRYALFRLEERIVEDNLSTDEIIKLVRAARSHIPLDAVELPQPR